MFNKKRNEKRDQEQKSKLQEIEQDFLTLISKADSIEDAGEKVHCLQLIDANIQQHRSAEKTQIIKKAQQARSNLGTGGNIVLTTGTWGLAAHSLALVSGPVGWTAVGIGWAAFAGSQIAAPIRKKSVTKKLEAKISEHLQNLDNIQAEIVKLTDKTIEENVTAISESQYYSTVMRWPGISEKFSIAAAKQIANESPEAPKASKPVIFKPKGNNL